MRPWICLAFSAAVVTAVTVFVVYPIEQRPVSGGVSLKKPRTFNSTLFFQAELGISMHPLHVLGGAKVLGSSLFSVM